MIKNFRKKALAIVGTALLVVTIAFSNHPTAHSQTGGAYVDIGLRLMESGHSTPTAVAIENPSVPTSGSCDVSNIAVFGGYQGSALCTDNLGHSATKTVSPGRVTLSDTLTLISTLCTYSTYHQTIIAAEEFTVDFTCSGAPSSANSPLMIAKNGVLYHVALVDPTDSAATTGRVKLADGTVKAMRSYP